MNDQFPWEYRYQSNILPYGELEARLMGITCDEYKQKLQFLTKAVQQGMLYQVARFQVIGYNRNSLTTKGCAASGHNFGMNKTFECVAEIAKQLPDVPFFMTDADKYSSYVSRNLNNRVYGVVRRVTKDLSGADNNCSELRLVVEGTEGIEYQGTNQDGRRIVNTLIAQGSATMVGYLADLASNVRTLPFVQRVLGWGNPARDTPHPLTIIFGGQSTCSSMTRTTRVQNTAGRRAQVLQEKIYSKIHTLMCLQHIGIEYRNQRFGNRRKQSLETLSAQIFLL
jgi:hypothetical protein